MRERLAPGDRRSTGNAWQHMTGDRGELAEGTPGIPASNAWHMEKGTPGIPATNAWHWMPGIGRRGRSKDKKKEQLPTVSYLVTDRARDADDDRTGEGEGDAEG